MANIVAIVGRPNVGKSTFFNRLVGQRKAIMDDESGVTRDRHYGYAEWIGKHFTVVDTGGSVNWCPANFGQSVREQGEMGTKEANGVLVLVEVEGEMGRAHL